MWSVPRTKSKLKPMCSHALAAAVAIVESLAVLACSLHRGSSKDQWSKAVEVFEVVQTEFLAHLPCLARTTPSTPPRKHKRLLRKERAAEAEYVCCACAAREFGSRVLSLSLSFPLSLSLSHCSLPISFSFHGDSGRTRIIRKASDILRGCCRCGATAASPRSGVDRGPWSQSVQLTQATILNFMSLHAALSCLYVHICRQMRLRSPDWNEPEGEAPPLERNRTPERNGTLGRS